VRGAQTYRFVVRGGQAGRLADLIADIQIRADGETTVITGTIDDQAHLRGVLDRMTDLELELVTLERIGPAPSTSDHKQGPTAG
jgi:carbon monoxide dehydrogenase subunit G